MKKIKITIFFFILLTILMSLYSCLPKNNISSSDSSGVNKPPIAEFSYAPTEVVEGREVEFNPTLSNDTEDTDANLSARWDFDGDGVWDIDYSEGKKAIDKVRHIYTTPGKYKVVLEVKDKEGEISQKEKEITVELAPPQNLRITGKGDTWIQLGWIDVSNNEDSYKIYRDGVEIEVLGSNAEEYTDTGIDFSATHTYSVVAYRGEEYSKSSELEIGINLDQKIKIEEIEVTIPGTYTGNEIVIENEGIVGEDLGEYEIESEGYKIYVGGADGELEDLPVEIKYESENNEESVLMTYIEGVGWIPLLTAKDSEGNIYTYLNDFEIINTTEQSGIIAKARKKSTESTTQENKKISGTNNDLLSKILDKKVNKGTVENTKGNYSINSFLSNFTVETPGFDPSINGLKFYNYPEYLYNVDHPLLMNFNLTEEEKAGLCFGMSATVKGLFKYNLPSDKPFDDNDIDFEGNEICDFADWDYGLENEIVSQELLEFVKDQQYTQTWANFLAATEAFFGSLEPAKINISNFNFAFIKMKLSNNNEKPSIIVLRNFSGAHAVVAYKIENYGLLGKVYVYDPNHPNEEKLITLLMGSITTDEYSKYLYFMDYSINYIDPKGIEDYENLVDKIYIPRFFPLDLGAHYYTNNKTVRLKWWYHAKPNENPSTKIWKAEGSDIYNLLREQSAPSEEQDLYEDSDVLEGKVYRYKIGYDTNRQSTERYVKTVDFEVNPVSGTNITPGQDINLTINSPDGSYGEWIVLVYNFNFDAWVKIGKLTGTNCTVSVPYDTNYINDDIMHIRVVGYKDNGWQSYFAVKDLEYVVQEGNNPPTTSSNPSPVNGATDVSLTPTLTWEASDPDGDSITFDVYFGTSSNPPLVVSNLTTNSYTPGTLNSNTTYYWKIVAKDGKGGVTEGPVWSFTTQNYSSIQEPLVEWQKALGGSGNDWAESIQQTNDGGYIVVGFATSNDGDVSGNHGLEDYLIAKLDTEGNIEWQKALGGSLDDYAYSVQQTSDGGYIVAGYTQSNDGDVSGNHGELGYDYWIVKLDSNGNIEWKKTLGGSDYDKAYSIQQTNDGGYIVVGHTWSNDGDVSGNHGGEDYWVVKLDSNGYIEWQKALGGSNYDNAYSIQQTNDGGYIVAGWASSTDGDVSGNHGGLDYWIVKLDAYGNIIWQKCLGGSERDWAESIQQTKDGGYIVAGYTESNDGDVSGNHGRADYWIVKLDAYGNIIWQKCLGGSDDDWAYSIQQTNDGGYIVAGWASSTDGDVSGNHGGLDYWIVKLDSNGNIIWQKALGGSDYDYAYSIQQTNDGGYIVAGRTYSNDGDVSGNHGGWDYWIVKLGF